MLETTYAMIALRSATLARRRVFALNEADGTHQPRRGFPRPRRPPPHAGPREPPSPMHYAAFTGDLVDSRNLPDRAQVQRNLRAALESLNAARRELLTVPLRVTAGDEVQGLTRSPEVLVDVMVGIADALFPVQVAWGMGVGSLTTELVEDVSLVDGPCFHRAREAVEEAKRSSRWLQVADGPGGSGVAVTALMNLLGALRSDWTPRQAEVVRAARGRLQIEVAEALEVHASTISRTLAAAHYEAALEGEAAARELLRQLPLDSAPLPSPARARPREDS